MTDQSPLQLNQKLNEMKQQHHGELSSDSESDLQGDVKRTTEKRQEKQQVSQTKEQKRQLKQARLAEWKAQALRDRQTYLYELAKVPKLRPGKLILILGWSLGMSALDNTIINIANPQIQKDKHFVEEGSLIPESQIQWINDLYSIAFSAFGIPAAKIGDRYGTTTVNKFGIIGFMIFSILCGVSGYIPRSNALYYGGFYILLVSRLFQGIFAAFLMSNSISLCGILVEQKDVRTSLSYNSFAFAIGAGLGPVVGGILTATVGWQFNFFINVVIGTVGLVLCWIYLPKVPKFKEAKLDWFGGILVLIALITLILGFTFIPPDRENVPLGVIMTIIGIGLLIGFIFWELNHPFAILPAKVLKNKQIIYSLVAGLFNFALITPVTFQMPFCLQGMKCIPAWEVGLICLASPIAQMIASQVAKRIGNFIPSFWIKIVTSGILFGLTILFGYIVRFDGPGGITGIIITAFVFAFVLMTYFVSNNMFVMFIATPDVRGIIGGCLQAFRESGLAIGIALSNLFNDLLMGSRWPGKQPTPNATCTGDQDFLNYRSIYFDVVLYVDIIMSIMSILSLVFAILTGFGDYEYKFRFFPKKLKEGAQARQTELDQQYKAVYEKLAKLQAMAKAEVGKAPTNAQVQQPGVSENGDQRNFLVEKTPKHDDSDSDSADDTKVLLNGQK